MQLKFESVTDLEESLRRAAEAHDKHEEAIGEEDLDWPSWYAKYMEQERVEREATP
jgi:hypothetical protein